MCELCDLREQTEQLMSEQAFRYTQYQVELNAERHDAVKTCENRIHEISRLIMKNLKKKRSLEIQYETIGEMKVSH